MRMLQKIERLFFAEEAVTTVEYALLLVLIVLAIAQTVVTLGTNARDVLDATAKSLN